MLLVGSLLLATLFKRREHTQHDRSVRNEYRMNTILDTVDAMVSIKDPDGRYIYANNRFSHFFGVANTELMMRTDREVIDDPQLVDFIEYSDRQVLKNEKSPRTQATRVSAVTYKEHALQVLKIPLHNAAGHVEAVCTILTDATDRLQAEAQAHRLSFYDDLTDLPNRRMLLSRLEQTLKSVSGGKTFGALLLLELDDFKAFADHKGRTSGDQILQRVAQRLVARTREFDMVSRTGNGEFMVLLTSLGHDRAASMHGAMIVAEKLQKSLTTDLQPSQTPGDGYALHAHVGLTLLDGHRPFVDDVLREADVAMAEAKTRGSDAIVFYDPEAQSAMEELLWVQRDLNRAIDAQQLTLHIQPQYACDGTVAGAELLMRWEHPTRGFIPPETFIPLAESSGMILHLTSWSLEIACETVNALRELGDTYPVAVNMHPAYLMDASVVSRVQDILARTGAPPHQLVFEITENVLIRDMEATTRRLQEIHRMGIRFSIDDFGTGYSNFAYLKRLPVHEIKIDQSLIQDIPENADNTAIVDLILGMAEQLDLQIVAEGIERPSQVDYLYRRRCHALQGYLLAKPMPISQWTALRRQQKAETD